MSGRTTKKEDLKESSVFDTVQLVLGTLGTFGLVWVAVWIAKKSSRPSEKSNKDERTPILEHDKIE
jgi:hypothetical protein